METLIVEIQDKQQVTALKSFLKAFQIKFKAVKSESPYNQEFVEKINKSRAEAEKGNLKSISLDDIWK